MSSAIVYRGPLERSRVAFLVQAAKPLAPGLFVWISPVRLTPEKRAAGEGFLRGLGLSDIRVLEHPARRVLSTRRAIARLTKGHRQTLIAIGFSAPFFAPRFPRLIWCVNGVPEEDLLTRSDLGSAWRARLQWAATRISRPALTVVVSEPMARLVRRHHPRTRLHVAPTCADLDQFRTASADPAPVSPSPVSESRTRVCYLGTGAPWQALDLVAAVWRAMHEIDPDSRFRVISRDPRVQVLAEGIDPDAIEFVGSDDFAEVARWLSGCDVGFLLRRPLIVNEVSFPTKLGEYLAAGLWVVASDLDWDIARYVRASRCGVLVPPDEAPFETARRVLKFRAAVNGERVTLDLDSAAAGLSRQTWLGKTQAVFEEYL